MVDRCMIKECVRPVNKRGLCLQCYNHAYSKVESGEVTWAVLEAHNLCQKVSDPFDDAYMQAMKDH